MYTYQALDLTEIRILTLLPGTFGSEIHVELSHVKLDINNPPSYEALSYTWGSYDLSHVMFVDTVDGRKGLAVTENLYNALQHLRNMISPRTLWVDATCINQGDVEERSQQVARMADIYKCAVKVLIWIGPEADNSTKALEALETLASKIHVDWGRDTISTASEEDIDSEWLDHNEPAPFEYQTWVYIGRVLDRPWFSRLWIWQEVSLAHNGAIVICGESTMSWQNFCKAIASLIRRPIWTNIPNLYENMVLSWELCRPKRRLELQSILQNTRNAKCSDQRDRIYGVLNLVEESDRLGIKPDYTKITVQLFQDVMLSSISRTRSLDLLTCCESQGERDDIPSWVPNWSLPKRCCEILSTNAGLNSAAQATYNERDGCLIVIGVHVEKIQKVQQILTIDSWSLQTIHAALQKVTLWLRSELGSDAYDRQMDTIWRTLCCNQFSDFWEPQSTIDLHFQKSLDQFRILTNSTVELDDSFLNSHQHALGEFYDYGRNRSITITSKDQLGIAPQASRPGDFIVVFLGCRSPMVLRPKENSAYLVVGEAYVDGLVTGEAFLGPLPSNWQYVIRYDDPTDRYWDAFIDRVRNKCQSEDPRLGPLPEGWVEDEYPEQHGYALYRDVEEDYTTRYDPRMLPGPLRARNVELTEFKLV
ncbi:MAG: hypothetical protein LQ337_006463 [Flavoplaca oasis]|nr:MAG: hypothetical protein LQ337_006463 [Flavoplaca oasis]